MLRLGGPLALGRVLGGGGLLVTLAVAGVPLADYAPPLAFRSAFGCTGCHLPIEKPLRVRQDVPASV